MKYQVDDGNAELTIEADSAREAAQEYVDGGSWDDDGEGASIEVMVWTVDDGEETEGESYTIDLEPDHALLMDRAGAPDDCEHNWSSVGEGGCDQNPGVWATGGTSMMSQDHCRLCGLIRAEQITGSQRNPGDHDTVEYGMPTDDERERQRKADGMLTMALVARLADDEIDLDATGDDEDAIRAELRAGYRDDEIDAAVMAEIELAAANLAEMERCGFVTGAAPRATLAPTTRTLQRQDWDGQTEATDGCHVEPDGTCSHGSRSWLLVYGLI